MGEWGCGACDRALVHTRDWGGEKFWGQVGGLVDKMVDMIDCGNNQSGTCVVTCMLERTHVLGPI